MKRILLSALAARRGGGVTYLRAIVAAFPDRPDLRLTVLAHEPCEDLPARANVEWIKAPRWAGPPITRFLIGFFHFRFFWPRRREFDIVFHSGGTFDLSLPGKVARVVAFRNVLPFDREARLRYGPGWMRFRHWLLRYVQGWAMRRAEFVIFISDHGRRVIDKALGPRRGGSAVIRHGVARGEVPLDPETARRLPDRFILYLSTIDAYKAQLELVEAWALLRAQRPLREKLVLAGPVYRPYARRVTEAIARHGLEEEIILLGPVQHDQIFDLAGRAFVNLFLSSCENCPFIMLELMSVGRPMLVSSRQPMPELGGPELSYVDPYDEPAIVTELGRLLDDAAMRERLGEAAARRARLFSWEQCAAATWQAVQAALDERAPVSGPSGGRPPAVQR